MTKLNTTINRRKMLAGTAAGITATGMAASGLSLGLTSAASAAAPAVTRAPFVPQANSANALCVAHHQELSQHLSKVLNASYVDERMKNTMLTTTNCPHCKVAIAPDMKTKAAFAALS